MFDVAILAGGFGTRLKGINGDLPKPLLKIKNKNLLEYQLENCKKYGYYNIAILVHHNYEEIIRQIGHGEKFELNIKYFIEKSPRGTAGAVKDILKEMNDDFLVIYGDTFFEIDLNKFRLFHINNNSDLTVFSHPNDHPHDSDLIEVLNGKIINVHGYPHKKEKYYNNLVNAALYYINKKKIFEHIADEGKLDFAKNIFPNVINKLNFLSYKSQEYIKDVGTPERINIVTKNIDSGLVEKLSIKNKRKACFIDRDGTIIKLHDQLNDINKVELLEGVSKSIKRLNENGILAVCITNQPVIARGELSLNGLNNIHAKIETLLGEEGAYLDEIYYCPHHPDKGFKNEVIELKIECDCRKPKSGMIKRAEEELNIDLKNSYFIGDTTSDILTAKNAGIKSILVKTGCMGKDKKYNIVPDFKFENLDKSINFIINDCK